jgi:hypothetical protein
MIQGPELVYLPHLRHLSCPPVSKTGRRPREAPRPAGHGACQPCVRRAAPGAMGTQSTRQGGVGPAHTDGGRDVIAATPGGSCQDCFEVGSDLGHDLLGAADPRLPAALADGVALAAVGSGRGSHGDRVPGDLLVDGDGHGTSDQSVMAEPTPLGKPITKFSVGSSMRSVTVGLVTPRQGAGADRRARRCRRADEQGGRCSAWSGRRTPRQRCACIAKPTDWSPTTSTR